MRKDEWIGLAVLVTVVATILVAIYLLVTAPPPPSFREQVASANKACRDRGGVEQFDDLDQDGSGEGPANVICRDRTLLVLGD